MMKEKITLVMENTDGYFSIISPDLPELHLGGYDIKAVFRDLGKAIYNIGIKNYGWEDKIFFEDG